MQASFSLTLSQTQKLVMTPELRQAITILQLSALELDEYIEQELLENPLLDLNEDIPKNDDIIDKQSQKDSDTIDWEDYFQDCSDLDFLRFPLEKKEEELGFENFVSSTPSLQEHLIMQLHLCSISRTEFKIGEFLIGNLDKRGYLTISTAEAAKLLKVSEQEVEKVLKLIQTFEPAGIGARNLIECLLIQVEQRNIDMPKIKELITGHLKDLAEARYSRIAEALNISLSEVQRLKDVILTLDPKPGRNFSSVNDTQYIIPDAVIEKVGNDYVVIMNDSVSPRLSINSYYRSLLYSENRESNISKFLSQRLDSALWLIKSIEQRRITLNKVISTIVEVQRDFLDYGVTCLKPLTMKQIADRVGIHESTVSRAISGKYVQTPRGLFELKFFFKNGLDNTNGSSTSSESIKKMIKEMVGGEDPYNPLSDQKIADDLKKKGIIISRRTVAKYREEIGIPSSAKRKRY
ncbi:MAG: polymerase sigma-54 factor [Thermoanaerobacteraceae bacterium]|jgi:RNA polymerase sigma-54 factor|nr:polymerase sigma-54 factor [Thermoanaerobacteraceae bacterium]MDN5301052.1 polymerase sigma-54 factor [Thermoanaerobacteraceae bacterium]MDN5311594.1 polymerase sigma-54 factor [Thermoanaerobacteraceae bacterium]RKL63985.1 RNA polymerase sigma-54 factor [Thermoanaerobacteraceae bacterium SP2]